ncbi:MAG: alpha/beta hydrolase [Treponemataceae bacterium]
MTICLFILFGLSLFGFVGGLYIFNSLFVRQDSASQTVRGVKNILFTHTRDEKIIIPLTLAKERWQKNNLESVLIKSKEGFNLCGDLRLAPNSDGKITLLIHGFRDCANGMAYLAEEYYSRGFSVLAIDCRAHGNSQGNIMGMGYWDAHDLVLWIDFVVNRVGSNCKIVLHGVSMGGAAILSYTGLKNKRIREQCNNIVLFVSDSAFASFSNQFAFQLKTIFNGCGLQSIFRFFLLHGTSLVSFFKNHFFYCQHSPLRRVKNRYKNNLNDIPLLLFHGTADSLVLPKNAEKIYHAASGKKHLEFVENAPHIGAYFYDSNHYFSIIMKLYNKMEFL